MSDTELPPGAEILAAGLICSAGKDFKQSVRNYATRTVSCIAEPSAIGPDGKPPTLALAMPFDQPRDSAKRLTALVFAALSDAYRSNLPPVPVVIMLPYWAPAHVRDAISARFPPEWSDLRFVQSQTASSLAQLGFAVQAINDGKIDGALVCAVDSLANADRMDALMLNDAIYSKTNPYGIIPGEAAAVLRLAPAGMPGAVGQVRAVRAAVGAEMPPGALRGRALAGCLRALAPFIDQDAPPTRLLTDLSGPRGRAEAFGTAAAASGPTMAKLAHLPEAPSGALGDLGQAFGLVLACLALAPPPASFPDGDRALIVAAGADTAALIQRYEGGGA